MATASHQQPHWEPPPPPSIDVPLPPLKVWNSLTRSKTLFVPKDWKNRNVSWYACGPTVYDDAHLGHARNYVSTDIIRRTMRDYFKYNVKFVMNITDIDDKIILRGRQQHLLEKYLVERRRKPAADHDTELAALRVYLAKNLPKIPSDTPPKAVRSQIQTQYAEVLDGKSLDGGVQGEKEGKLKMHIKTVLTASDALALGMDIETDVQDILVPYLDSQYGSSIDANDHTIFTKLTQKFEDRFMEDVRALNCLDPDDVTRVTEYGKQIVDFVRKVQDNGFAYATSDGSVYFDINAFEKANNCYARLEPWNRNDKDLQADGEGALSKKTSEKRSEADFALWKSSKPGEPSWPSPWGKGRPGWHIECSAMASDKLGSQLDIHSGGIDLAFPHHDNELAQSEAYWADCTHQHQHQWVNYFMHMGHLSIQGSKMSKSLKNFTTIREALSRGDWTPRGLRIAFLLGGWKEGIEITDELVKAGSAWEEKVNNFFINVMDRLENVDQKSTGEANLTLTEALERAKDGTFDALCDSFNTPTAMAIISELISSYNATDKMMIDREMTHNIALWVTSMVNTFGLDGSASPNDEIVGWSGISIPNIAKPYLKSLSQLRDDLRRKARTISGLTMGDIVESKDLTMAPHGSSHPDAIPYKIVLQNFRKETGSLKDSPTLSKELLQLCDRVRDVDLWDLGICLEDRDSDQPALIRLVTKDLQASRMEKEEREKQKQKAKEHREREAAAKADKGRQSHLDMFRTDEYTAWDAEGLPTKDKEGNEIAKNKVKKLKKEWEKQKERHELWKKAKNV